MVDEAVLPVGDRETRWSYQELLRATGAILDRDAAGPASIVEVDDGFLLRRERVRHTQEDLALTHVTRPVLRAYGLKHRQVRPTPVARRTMLWSDYTDSYQDFFRALGYELDSVGARNIVVDVLSNGLLLGYEQDGDSRGMRHAQLSTSDIEEVLNDAVRRRQAGSTGAAASGATDRAVLDESIASPERAHWTPVRDEIAYQQVLRAVGSILDKRRARRVCVMESPNGMVLRYEPENDSRLIRFEVSDDDLEAEAARLRQVPLFSLSSQKRTDPYEDLFRALGHDLERDKASGILISEGQDEITVACQFLDPRNSFARAKHMLTLSRGAQQDLVDRALGRKKPVEKQRRALFGRKGG